MREIDIDPTNSKEHAKAVKEMVSNEGISATDAAKKIKKVSA